MQRQLPPTAYAILGMLSLAPMSGYELLANVGKSIAHFWTISKSQAYAELGRLEDAGLVTGTDVAQEGAPDKRTYQLTDAGTAALDDWLAEVAFEETKTRSLVLLKVFFAYRMPPDVFVATLERYRAESEKRREHLAAIVSLLDGLPETFYPRATALLGLRTAEASVGWVEEVLAEIPARRTEEVRPGVAEKVARDILATTPSRPTHRRQRS
jgi:PadR family transcriptional regulator, regulatory protein AphA